MVKLKSKGFYVTPLIRLRAQIILYYLRMQKQQIKATELSTISQVNTYLNAANAISQLKVFGLIEEAIDKDGIAIYSVTKLGRKKDIYDVTKMSEFLKGFKK